MKPPEEKLSIRHHYGLLTPSYDVQLVTITTHKNFIDREDPLSEFDFCLSNLPAQVMRIRLLHTTRILRIQNVKFCLNIL